jgi:hypothetical protein
VDLFIYLFIYLASDKDQTQGLAFARQVLLLLNYIPALEILYMAVDIPFAESGLVFCFQ